jgi:hypothetical protein
MWCGVCRGPMWPCQCPFGRSRQLEQKKTGLVHEASTQTAGVPGTVATWVALTGTPAARAPGVWRSRQLRVRGHRVRAEPARAGSVFFWGGAPRYLSDSESPSHKQKTVSLVTSSTSAIPARPGASRFATIATEAPSWRSTGQASERARRMGGGES